MSAAPPSWVKGMERAQSESGGLMQLYVVTPPDVPGLLSAALGGNREAGRVMTLVGGMIRDVEGARGSQAKLCALCPRPLRRSSFSVCIAVPMRDDPTRAVALGICRLCGPGAAALQVKAMQAFRTIWPDAKTVDVTHPTGGRA